MRVTIEFEDGDGCDAASEAIDALRVHEYRNALDRIQNEIRRMWKYEEHNDEAAEVIVRLREFVFEQIGCLLDD